MNALITQLKESGQDFEFYPTTDEIINQMIRDLKEYRNEHYRDHLSSVLDIGAGNGKVLRALRDRDRQDRHDGTNWSELYAIEKSIALCEQLDDEIYIVGTEFTEQSLLAKQVDMIFCNPPYSEFVQWSVKIIRESAAGLVYLVIPVRWKDSVEIADALKFRDGKAKVVGEFSFEDAEDRTARCKVNLIRIELSTEKDDAFDRFFDEQFAGLKAKFAGAKKKDEDDDDKDSLPNYDKNPKFKALVSGPNFPAMLVALYDEEMAHIMKNYDLVAQLDADLLKEFDVTPKRILACLKARLSGLRNTYWKELVDRMSQVTNRLCSKKRQQLLEKLQKNGHVDFTLSNICAVIIWILKNANNYYDSQLIETFEKMVEKANVKNYKSNQRVFTFDRWRYNEEKPSHIALEYRMVLQHVGGIRHGYSFEKGLEDRAAEFLRDLLTVARNLGFDCNTQPPMLWCRGEESWESGRVHCFDGIVDGKGATLVEARAFLNGNMHLRIHQKFALAMNVEVGRLKGWLHTGQEAAEELDDEEAPKYFSKNLQLGQSNLLMLAGPPTPVADEVVTDQPDLPLEEAV